MKSFTLVTLFFLNLSYSAQASNCQVVSPFGKTRQFPSNLVKCDQVTLVFPVTFNNFNQSQLIVGQFDFKRRADQLILKAKQTDPNVREIQIQAPPTFKDPTRPLSEEMAKELLSQMSRQLGPGGATRYHWRTPNADSKLASSVNKACFDNTTVSQLAEVLVKAPFCGNRDSLWELSACDNPTVWTQQHGTAQSASKGEYWSRKIGNFIPNAGKLFPPAPAMNIDQKLDCGGSANTPLRLIATLRHTRKGLNSLLLVDTEQVWEFSQEGTDACFTEHYVPISEGESKDVSGAGFTSGHKAGEQHDRFIKAHEEMVMILTANMTERLRQSKKLSNKYDSNNLGTTGASSAQTPEGILKLPCLSRYSNSSGKDLSPGALSTKAISD